MKRVFRYIGTVLCCAILGLAAAWLSRILIMNLGYLAERIAHIAGADSDTAAYTGQILGQLKLAQIHSPWAASAVAGAALGVIMALAAKKRTCRVLVPILVFIPGIIIAFCFTEVNGILTFALLRRLLPAAAALL